MIQFSPHRSPRETVSTAIIVAVLGIAGCTSAPSATVTDLPDVDTRPQGVQDPADIPESAGENEDCDPLDSYKPSSSTKPAEIQDIIDRDRLIVGVDQTTYLMGYRDPASGKMDGFDIRIAQEIADDLLGDPDKIQYVAMSSSDRETALREERVDIVVRTMTITCDRWENVGFSSEYYRAGQKVLVPSGASDELGDLAGEKICAAEGSTSLNRIDEVLNAEPVSVLDWTDCMIMLQQGHVHAMSTDDVILAGMAAQDPNTKVIGEAISEEPYGVGVNSAHVGLAKFVNSTLERIRDDGTWDDIYHATLGDTLGDASPPNGKHGRSE